MSVAVVLPAGSYRVSDTEVALLQQLLLLLPVQDTFNSVLKSFSGISALTTNDHLDRHCHLSFLSCTLLFCALIVCNSRWSFSSY